MAVIGSLSLLFRAQTDQLVKGLNQAATQVGGFADRLRANAKGISDSLFKVPEHIGRMARGAALGLTVLNEGLQTAGMESQSVGGKILNVASSVAVGYAAGGPIGAALGGLMSVFKVFGDTGESETQRVARAQAKLAQDIGKATAALFDQTRALEDQAASNRGGEAEVRRRTLQDLDDEIGRERGLLADLRAQGGAAWTAQLLKVNELLNKRRALLDKYASEDEKAEKEHQDRIVEAGIEANRKRVHDVIDARMREVNAERAAAAEVDEINRRKVRSIIEAGRAMADAIRAQDAQTDAAASQAKGELWSPEKIQQEKMDLLERVYRYAKGEADEAERAARAAKEKTKAKEEEIRLSRLVSSRQDITRRFSAVGGSLFGFGAGQAGTGLGDVGADAARANAAARTFVPAMNRTRSAVSGVAPHVEKLAAASKGLAAAAVENLNRVADAVAGAVGRIWNAIDAMGARVKSLENRLAKSGSLGSGA